MALTANQIYAIATNPTLQHQVSVQTAGYAAQQIGTATGASLALCQAVLRSPMSYAYRFLLDLLIVNAATLVTTDGVSLSPMPTDAVVASAVQADWSVQAAVGP